MLNLITGFLFFSWTDFIITPLYIYIAFRWFKAFVERNHGTDPYVSKMLMYAFWLKIAGSVILNSIYEFYYQGGDIEGYYGGSEGIYNSLFYNPFYTIKMLVSSADDYKDLVNSVGYLSSDKMQFITTLHFLNTPELTTIKIAGLSSFLCFHTYTTIGIFFALFAFAGSYKLFIMLRERYPDMVKPIMICCFFIPSVIIWGGGLLKDPITYGATCFVIYYLNLFFVKKEYNLINIVSLVVSSVLIVLIKPYIFMSLTPAIFLYVLINYARTIKSNVLFLVVLPIVTVISLGLSFAIISVLKNELGKYSLENLQDTMQNFQTWHTAEAKISGGSGYTLGELDYSTFGLIKKIPLAINVTFFRPYLWEVRKPIILLTALESLLINIFFLRTLFRAGVRLFFKTIIADPFTTFCLIFALIFGTAVGMSSYNFGALARYKIPCLPFFLLSIYLIDNQYKAALRKKATKKKVK